MSHDPHEPAASATDTDTAPPTLVQKLLAEFLGTAALVLLGCGVAVVNQGAVLQTGLAFGLTVTLMAYAFGRISGGHFNPAVSVGAAISGRISWRETGLYVAAQFVGGLIGAFVLMLLALGINGYEPFDSSTPLGTNGFSAGNYDYAVGAAFFAELVMTFLFVLVILAVTDERNRAVAVLAPLAIGLTLAIIHFFLVPLTGTSVNPARSFGPALLSGGDWLLQLWPFLLAPTIGGALAGLTYPAVFGRGSEPVPGSGLSLGSGGSSSPGFTQQWNQGQQWPQGGVPGGVPGGVTGYEQQPGAQQPAQQGYGSTGYAGDAGTTQALPTDQGSQGSQAAQPAQQQPIIQDGWQWDPAAQQWIPAQQEATPPSSTGWSDPGSDRTQIRPPQ